MNHFAEKALTEAALQLLCSCTTNFRDGGLIQQQRVCVLRMYHYLSIFRKSVQKIQFSFKSDKNNGYFTQDLCTFMIISR
jgi:hypothetical protein